MAYNVSDLTNYVNQEQTDILLTLQIQKETASFASLHPDVKSAKQINFLANDPIPQDGSTCSFNASGSTTFTKGTLSTSAVKYDMEFCPRTLETKWTQKLLRRGQNYTESDVPKIVVDDILERVQAQLETADWTGDTTSGSSYLNRYDGLIKLIKAATGTNVATASTWNATNARAIVKNIISKIPASRKGDPRVKIYMGYDAAETYRQALMDANLYHVATGTGDQKGLMAEGSVHEIVPVHGLDGLTGNTGDNPFIFALDFEKSCHLGFDAEVDENDARLWYSQDNDTVRMTLKFRRGWYVAFPGEIVEYSNS